MLTAPISASTASARIRQAEHQRHLVQAVLAHEVGAHAREVAFVGTVEAVEQQPRDGHVQHRVAQEFQALVVVGAEAAVREGALEQRALDELVAEPLLDERRPAGRRRRRVSWHRRSRALRPT
jgi:hypothetical protein